MAGRRSAVAAVLLCAAAFACLLATASAYYLPGVAARNYKVRRPSFPLTRAHQRPMPPVCSSLPWAIRPPSAVAGTGGEQEGDEVELEVNVLTSPNSVVPFDYYHKLLNFCGPEKPKPSGGSLGAILFGDRKYDSIFKLYMLHNTTCNVLCTRQNTKQQNNFLIARIQERYLLNWCGHARAGRTGWHVRQVLMTKLACSHAPWLPFIRLVDSLPAARMTKDGDTIFYSIGFDLGKRDDKAVRGA